MQRPSRFSKKILLKNFCNARLITVDRENALNSMDLEMIRELHHIFFNFPHRKGHGTLFVIKGAGEKSFCSGGDVVAASMNFGVAAEFFYLEYQVNCHILTMPNPQVSLWNGYVMGGGVGISVHGRYRVASERTVFAMPETAIGFFPDVGASWFLPRLQMKGLGLYLGLTGARLKGADLVHAGLATHYVPHASFAKLEERLCNIDDTSKVGACLEEFSVKELPPFSLEPHRETIAKNFTLNDETTVEGIFESLSKDSSDFATEALGLLRKASPTSLCVALEMQKRGAKMTKPADVFRMEYWGAVRCCKNPDFREGVRALLIDKTKDPKWNPVNVADVTKEYVESYFKPGGYSFREWRQFERY